MNLAEFLLARIAEDEERARERMHYAQQTHLLLQDPKYLGLFIPGWHEWPDIEADAARVLAECKAKRRIVEQSQAVSRHGAGRVVAPELRWVLATLALPYAGHPDFDEDWRP